MLKIPTGERLRIIVGGQVVTITPVCTGVEPRPVAAVGADLRRMGIATRNITDAVWDVRITCNGRTRSFRYTVGDGNANFDRVLDFDSFADCIVSDSCHASMSLANFCAEFEYGENEGREVWKACKDNAAKLAYVFGSHCAAFNDHATYNGWIL